MNLELCARARPPDWRGFLINQEVGCTFPIVRAEGSGGRAGLFRRGSLDHYVTNSCTAARRRARACWRALSTETWWSGDQTPWVTLRSAAGLSFIYGIWELSRDLRASDVAELNETYTTWATHTHTRGHIDTRRLYTLENHLMRKKTHVAIMMLGSWLCPARNPDWSLWDPTEGKIS